MHACFMVSDLAGPQSTPFTAIAHSTKAECRASSGPLAPLLRALGPVRCQVEFRNRVAMQSECLPEF